MSVLTKDLIKRSEENAVKGGTFSFGDLMFKAGTAVAEEILSKFDIKDKKLAVVCGNGNNGGDGFVIADILQKNGGTAEVILPLGEPKTDNARFYFKNLNNIPVKTEITEKYDILVDALFGFGFTLKSDTRLSELFEKINNSAEIIISVDIPSGVECDTGRIYETAVKADFTYTFIALKPCFLLPKGSDFCGEVKVLDIGVKPEGCAYSVIKEPSFKPRPHNCHKGTFGTALLICGSLGFAGAAMLSAKAALRSGLGIAKCLIPHAIYSPFISFLPEAVCTPTKTTRQGTVKFSARLLKAQLKGSNAVLCGCGCGNSKAFDKAVQFLISNSRVPIVFDADGINALSRNIELLKKSKAPIILTPHPGEMARLIRLDARAVEADRINIARKFAKEYNCILVLKGANTLVANPQGKIFFNTLGNTGMATGGSGDVLAGITVSLLAQGFSPEEAALGGVYLHSLAGDKAASKRSHHALLPTDIIEEL